MLSRLLVLGVVTSVAVCAVPLDHVLPTWLQCNWPGSNAQLAIFAKSVVPPWHSGCEVGSA
jgi:hypothetical protein